MISAAFLFGVGVGIAAACVYSTAVSASEAATVRDGGTCDRATGVSRVIGTISNEALRDKAIARVERSLERDRGKETAPTKAAVAKMQAAAAYEDGRGNMRCGHSKLAATVDENGVEVCTQCTEAG
jgi:hypothetical protein